MILQELWTAAKPADRKSPARGVGGFSNEWRNYTGSSEGENSPTEKGFRCLQLASVIDWQPTAFRPARGLKTCVVRFVRLANFAILQHWYLILS